MNYIYIHLTCFSGIKVCYSNYSYDLQNLVSLQTFFGGVICDSTWEKGPCRASNDFSV